MRSRHGGPAVVHLLAELYLGHYVTGHLVSRRVLEKSGLSLDPAADDETVDTWRGERHRLRFVITAAEWPRPQP